MFYLSIHQFINIGLFLIFGYCDHAAINICVEVLIWTYVFTYVRYIPRS